MKRRVVLSLAALLVSKLIAVGTPFFYKAAVDALAQEAGQRGVDAGDRGGRA